MYQTVTFFLNRIFKWQNRSMISKMQINNTACCFQDHETRTAWKEAQSRYISTHENYNLNLNARESCRTIRNTVGVPWGVFDSFLKWVMTLLKTWQCRQIVRKSQIMHTSCLHIHYFNDGGTTTLLKFDRR